MTIGALSGGSTGSPFSILYANWPSSSKLALAFLSFSVIMVYWLWSISPTMLKTTQKTIGNPEASSRGGHCLNDNYLLTKKIRTCEDRFLLKPVKPRNFRPRQVSLTYYGVKGEMGVSWVTYDGKMVRFAQIMKERYVVALKNMNFIHQFHVFITGLFAFLNCH